MDVERVVEKGILKAHELGASEAEVFVVKEEYVYVRNTYGYGRYVRRGSVIGASVRVAIGKRVATQGAIVSSVEGILALVSRAISMAKNVSENPKWVGLPESYGFTPVYDIVDDRVRNLELEWVLQLVDEGFKAPGEVDGRALASDVRGVLKYTRRWVGNSYVGKAFSYDRTTFSFALTVKASDGGLESSYSSFYLAPTAREFDLRSLVEKTTKVAIATLKSKPLDQRSYNVIFMPATLAYMVDLLLVPAVKANLVQEGRSPLATKLFNKVLSDEITVIDDGSAPNMIRSAPFDDEGVQTKRKTVIDRGVLMTYLYDTYTAHIDSQESTGNAIRSSIESPPMPNATNIIMIPGVTPVEDVVRDLRDVLIVYGVSNTGLSNMLSGTFRATISSAVYYRNGIPVHGVRGSEIAGNLYEFLGKNLVAVTREVELVKNMLLPAICVSNVAVLSRF